MNKNQFEILASKMRAGALRNAVLEVMVNGFRQCEAIEYHAVSKQNLSQAIKRLKKRQAEFKAMAKAAK